MGKQSIHVFVTTLLNVGMSLIPNKPYFSFCPQIQKVANIGKFFGVLKSVNKIHLKPKKSCSKELSSSDNHIGRLTFHLSAHFFENSANTTFSSGCFFLCSSLHVCTKNA